MSKVKLSSNTLNVLKNFSTINSSILVREGNTLKTISVGENAVAEYECEEMFPQTFGIYDLPQFLMGLTLFDRPELNFGNDSYVNILSTSGGRSARYYFSSPDITLKAAPEREVKFPGADIQFKITQVEIESLLKAASIYSLPDLTFITKGDTGSVEVILSDKEDDTANVYTQPLKEDTTGEYELHMKVENIRLCSGEYNVRISKQLITEWVHTSLPLKYYIALEP